MGHMQDSRSVKGQVLALIRDDGSMPRAQIARRLDLSATTITRAVNELVAEEVLAEGQALVPSSAGRPAVNLVIRADKCLVGAVQIGIGLVQLGVYDAQGQELAACQFLYAVTEDAADTVLKKIASEFAALCKQSRTDVARLRGIGVAVPGPVDAAGRTMLVSIRLSWRNLSIADRLSGLTGLPVTIEHNVRAMALAEARFGQGRGLGSVAFVYLRSGLGAGLIVHGQPFSGGVHGAIELGHLPIIEGGAACVCGGSGCIETVLSEEALRATVKRLKLVAKPNALTSIWHAAATRADAGQAVEAVIAPLARGLNAITTLLNPSLLVLGGALAEIPDEMFDLLVQTTWRGAFPLIRESIRIERSSLGMNAGLPGAAAVALDHFLYA